MFVDVDLGKRKNKNKQTKILRNVAYLCNFLKIGFVFLTTWSFMFAHCAILGPVKMSNVRPVKKKHAVHVLKKFEAQFEESNMGIVCLPVKIMQKKF